MALKRDEKDDNKHQECNMTVRCTTSLYVVSQENQISRDKESFPIFDIMRLVSPTFEDMEVLKRFKTLTKDMINSVLDKK